MTVAVRHPAKYSDALLPYFEAAVTDCDRILDPFAGTGKVHALRRLGHVTVGVELEPEWAEMSPYTVVGDATALPFADDSFDAIVTSPCYGNRMADHHDARDACKPCDGNGVTGLPHGIRRDPKTQAIYGTPSHVVMLGDHTVKLCKRCGGSGLSRRNTYTHALGRKLRPNNAGAMQWSSKNDAPYKTLHRAAWREARRVLKPYGVFVLNISDHIRGGSVMPVTEWHVCELLSLGFERRFEQHVDTPRNREGANGGLRLDGEKVFVFQLVDTKRYLP